MSKKYEILRFITRQEIIVGTVGTYNIHSKTSKNGIF